MKVDQGKLVFDQQGVEASIHAGWDWAEIQGREHRAKVFATQGDKYVLVKELNGRVTIMPLSRIVALHREEA